MLGTSARIGEVLAIRVADLDLDAPVPMVRIAGTIVSRKGEPTHRQEHPKTARSVRRLALPGFALRAVRARVRSLRFVGPENLLFATRVGTPHTTNNVRRRQLRDVMDQAGINDVTPHRFRRTAATAINDVGGLQLASELLGHSDPAVTREHYIRRNETVNPATAGFLEQAFGRAS
ncbi:site-specific integrase [Citricoccus zhacaiensis]